MPCSKSLPSSGIESEIERMTAPKKTACNHTLLHQENEKFQLLITYGRNSVSELASSNDVATNGVIGRNWQQNLVQM